MLQLTGSFQLCALLATIISPIVADYVIDVKLIKFENYNRLLANGRTCSGFGNRCQTALHVCAKPADSSALCSYGETKTGVIGDNAVDLNKTFIGLVRNPITYQVRQPFQKFVVSFTANSNNELISEYVYYSGNRFPQKGVDEAKYELKTTGGKQNPSSQLTYQIRTYCSQGYYGPNCIVRCNIPISEQMRFTCDNNGQKVCKPGFTGQFCTLNANVCQSSPCKNGGTCSVQGSTFRCHCAEGYSGQYCNKGIDECILTTYPCLNGGTCVDEIGRYHCRCASGFMGPRCQTVISACSSSPCLNGGQCSDVGTSFRCSCPTNFRGTRCEIEDKCRSMTCQNGGQCVTANFFAKCVCQPGFTGTHCEINTNSCQYSPCQNGGTCYPNGYQFTCICPAGFSGQRCEQPFCTATICQNGGTCQMVNNQITCQCRNGFQGDRCQVVISCYPPCQNGGRCNANTRICDCLPGSAGRDCSIRDACASKPCRNNGQCFTQNNYDYTCMCQSGWTGKNCERSVMSCATNPCMNGGMCYPTGNSFTCSCRQGWIGQRCETPSNLCTPNPCHNNGVCRRIGQNGFTCTCTGGWYGKLCDQRNPVINCPSRPCLNGGTCIYNVNQIHCLCPPGFRGQFCGEVTKPQIDFNCPESAGHFPDPKSCRHFYQCDWGHAYRKDCPGNLHFNPVLKVCDWQYRANCINRN